MLTIRVSTQRLEAIAELYERGIGDEERAALAADLLEAREELESCERALSTLRGQAQ